jgi:SAM-dependent methyltransferase
VLGEVAAHRTAASIADVGCSNGYVTNLISEVCSGDVFGFDYLPEYIDQAQARYPHVRFRRADLNREVRWPQTFELVCCFETLEHAGDLTAALRNLAAAVQDGGTLIVSVPVETGIWGLAKFVAKTMKGYPFDEIAVGRGRYLQALLTGEDLSRFRGDRYAWGTHFGFDWRALEKRIGQQWHVVKAYTSYGTRIIVARKEAARSVAATGSPERTTDRLS